MVRDSCSSKWLNSGSAFLHFGDRIILPFFVVHYPVLVVVAFYVLPWAIAPLMKGLVLTSISFVITLAIACLITRQLPLPHPAAETRD